MKRCLASSMVIKPELQNPKDYQHAGSHQPSTKNYQQWAPASWQPSTLKKNKLQTTTNKIKKYCWEPEPGSSASSHSSPESSWTTRRSWTPKNLTADLSQVGIPSITFLTSRESKSSKIRQDEMQRLHDGLNELQSWALDWRSWASRTNAFEPIDAKWVHAQRKQIGHLVPY